MISTLLIMYCLSTQVLYSMTLILLMPSITVNNLTQKSLTRSVFSCRLASCQVFECRPMVVRLVGGTYGIQSRNDGIPFYAACLAE